MAPWSDGLAQNGRTRVEGSGLAAAAWWPLSSGAPAILTGAAAAAAMLGLAGWGRLDLATAVVAAVAMLAVGLVLGRGLRTPAVRTAVASPTSARGQGPPAEAYALALELAPNPVMLVTGAEPDDLASRRISFANASARELLRVPREGALLVAALRHPDVLEAVDESLFGGLDRTLAYETGGAHNRHWRVWTKPLPAVDDAPRLALVIMRDETDVLLNERRRSDFLANASHELRTPLASLSGFIETLSGHARHDDIARERFLAIMSRQADRMARLIDDLMSLSRIELNEHVMPSAVCDLALVASDVADALAPQIAAKTIALKLRLPAPGSALVIGDRDQIVQVVQNLLDNALKYSRNGGEVEVEVASALSLDTASASSVDSPRLSDPDGGRMSLLTPTWTEGGRYALVRVADAGAGMAREHLPRLTERFYRVEGQKSGERSGTGLGLAIVKHIMNRHRGGFFVESAPQRGAAFCVYFAQAPDAAASSSAFERSRAPMA